jgi:hypothetical protein
MNDTIVPLRPRDQVARQIPAGATTPLDERIPVRITSEIRLWRVLRGLASVGLTARLDVAQGQLVIEEVRP